MDLNAQESPYRRVYEALRELIISEDLKPGDKLPSTRQLMSDFGVASHTAQRALRALVDARLVDVVPSTGVFVRNRVQIVERSSAFTRAPGPGERAPYDAETRLVKVDLVPAPTYVAVRLFVDPGAEVLLRKRHLVRDDRVVEIVSSYYPAEIAEGTELAQEKPLRGGSPAALERLGYAAEGQPAEWVYTRLPFPSEAAALRMPMESPVFRLLRTMFAAGARPVEVIEMVMDGEQHVLRYDL